MESSMAYQEPRTVNSNPDPKLRAQELKGFWFTVFFIYAPTILTVLLLRCVMLYYNYRVLDLGPVDRMLSEFLRWAENMWLSGQI